MKILICNDFPIFLKVSLFLFLELTVPTGYVRLINIRENAYIFIFQQKANLKNVKIDVKHIIHTEALYVF